jgi:hypothetical protein
VDGVQVSWWNNALYDTCSLITVDKILLDYSELEKHFHDLLAIELTFSSDQMRQDTIDRMRPRVKLIELPSVKELVAIFDAWSLSKTLAETDTLVFAAAIHHKYRVVTADKNLAKVLCRANLTVGNCAMILQHMVRSKVLTASKCNAILDSLVKKQDFILPPNLPQDWSTLDKYKFP